MPVRTLVTAASVPRLVAGARLKHDAARGRWVVLAPERVFMLDDTAAEVMGVLDGERSVQAMAELLAARFAAPADTVLADITEMLQDLADKGVLAA